VRRLGEVIRLSGGYLEQHGSPTPRLDAELLIGHALGLSRVDLYVHHDRPLSEPELASVRALLERRAAREPVAYVIGSWGFRGLTIHVDRRVLVPRPETEQLVDLCLELVGNAAPAPAVLDVGTGSGAIALALKAERPGWTVAGSDASAEALEVAAANGEALGLQVEWLSGDLLDAAAGRTFDLIVSNPPYVAQAEIDGLQPEVRDWEPRAALVAGPAGTEVLARLVEGAPRLLAEAGRLAVECGAGQAQAVATAMRERGLGDVGVRSDFAGVERFVFGERP
jgi:release factor glutamine methyltransferase